MSFSPHYAITHIVESVGGGDSFMGGRIRGLLTYREDDQHALNFALAAPWFKHNHKCSFKHCFFKLKLYVF